MDILHQQSLITNLIQKHKVVLFGVGGRGRGDWRWVSVCACVCVFANMGEPVIISLCHDSNNIIVVRVCVCECVKCSYLGNKWASLPGERAAQQAWGWPALLFLRIAAFLIFFLTPCAAIILKINLAQIKIVPLGSGKWLPCFYWEDKVFISSLVGFLWGGFLSLSNCPIKCNLGMSANPAECTVAH